MITFNIHKPDKKIIDQLKNKINDLAKPKGALGRLEEIALQIGLIQQTLKPSLDKPVNIIFAADHGIADEGVSKSPKEVTRQVVSNILNGGAGICFLCRQHGFQIKLIDGGVDYDFENIPGLISHKIRKGTKNFLHEPAMNHHEMWQAIAIGADIVSECHQEGSRVVSFGEMGIGNTAASSMWMTCLANIPLIECVGAGSGLDEAGIRHKYDILNQALNNYTGSTEVMDIITYFGGFEMVMAVGGMLRAAELGLVILIDGFIMTNCILAASRLYPEVINYCIFGHCGDEAGHKLLLDHIGVKPLLHMGLRLGEGSGSVCSFPLVDSAVRMINEMHCFSQASVTKYFK